MTCTHVPGPGKPPLLVDRLRAISAGVLLAFVLVGIGCGDGASTPPSPTAAAGSPDAVNDADTSNDTTDTAEQDSDDEVFWEAGPDETMITAELVPEFPRAGQPVELRVTVHNGYGKLDALVSYRVTGRQPNYELRSIPPQPPWQPTRCTEEYMLDESAGEMVPLDASYNPRFETPVDRVFTATTTLPQGFNHLELLVRYPNLSGNRRLDFEPSYLQGWTIDIP